MSSLSALIVQKYVHMCSTVGKTTQCMWQEQHPDTLSEAQHIESYANGDKTHDKSTQNTEAVEMDQVLACRSEPHLPLLSVSWSL